MNPRMRPQSQTIPRYRTLVSQEILCVQIVRLWIYGNLILLAYMLVASGAAQQILSITRCHLNVLPGEYRLGVLIELVIDEEMPLFPHSASLFYNG